MYAASLPKRPSVPGISIQTPIALVAAGAHFEHGLAAGDFHATLTQRRHQQTRLGMVAGCWPVVSASGRRADRDPLCHLGVCDVRAVAHRAGLGVHVKDVLEHCLCVSQKGAIAPVKLPQDSVLADREDGRPALDIDQHALEGLVHVQRFAGHVREVPGDAPGLEVERKGRVRV